MNLKSKIWVISEEHTQMMTL